MIDKLYVANLALQKIKAKRLISSFTETGPEANAVNTCYDIVRDDLLEENPFTFATKRWVLTETVETPVFTDDGCKVAYSLPDDFLKVTAISDRFAFWKIEANATGEKRLVSDTRGLKIKYTFRNDNPATYTSKFLKVLATKLAHELCYHIAEAARYAEMLYQEYERELVSAISSDSQSGSPDQVIQDAADRARYIGAPALDEPGTTWWPVIS